MSEPTTEEPKTGYRVTINLEKSPIEMRVDGVLCPTPSYISNWVPEDGYIETLTARVKELETENDKLKTDLLFDFDQIAYRCLEGEVKELEEENEIIKLAMESSGVELLGTDGELLKSELQTRLKKYEEAIEGALAIKELWLLSDDVPEEHQGEAQALGLMYSAFNALSPEKDQS